MTAGPGRPDSGASASAGASSGAEPEVQRSRRTAGLDAGVLLVHGRREHVVAWVRRGTLPVYLVPGTREPTGWWGVIAAGASQAGAPYDEGVPMLAGHPVPSRLRPAIGFFTSGRHALVCVAPKGWRQKARWVGWTPEAGRHPLPGLPVASPQHLAAAAGLDSPAAADTVATLLADAGGDAAGLVADLATALGLPFADACRGVSGASLPGAELVGPAPVAVRRFEKAVGEEKRLERELEEGL